MLPSRHVEIRLGIVIFVVMPDQEEIGIIVALGIIIGVQLGIKGESERFVVFTRMNLFLEEM